MTSEQAKVDPSFPAGGSTGAPASREAIGLTSGSLGASIKALREARGWSVGDVSARLKFSPRQIEALEADRWDALPQGPSLRGLVRNYARMLDVPPETLLQALPAHLLPAPSPVAHLGGIDASGTELPNGTTLPGAYGGARRGGFGWLLLILFGLALIGLAVYLFFTWWLPRSQGETDVSPVSLPFAAEGQVAEGAPSGAAGSIVLPAPIVPAAPAATPPATGAGVPPVETVMTPSAAPSAGNAAGASAPATVTPGAVPATAAPRSPTGPFVVPGMTLAEPAAAKAPEPPPAPAVPANRLDFAVTGASWVEVRDADGNIALSATLQPGDQRQVQVSPPARVVIGNAGGVQLTWGGQAVDLTRNQRGNVARLTLE